MPHSVPISTNWGGLMQSPGKTPIEKIFPALNDQRSATPVMSRPFLTNNIANDIMRRRVMGSDEFRCTDVAGHLSDCPVCSNLHGKEKLLYIFLGAMIIIIFLMIRKTLKG
jgi:hypothetical protein